MARASRVMFRSSVQAHFRYQLINKNHESDCADESSKKRSGKHTIQESKSCQSRDEDDRPRDSRNDPCNGCVSCVVVVTGVTQIHTTSHHGTNQQ